MNLTLEANVNLDRVIRLKFCKTPEWHDTYNKKDRVLGVFEGNRKTGPQKGGFWMPLPAKFAKYIRSRHNNAFFIRSIKTQTIVLYDGADVSEADAIQHQDSWCDPKDKEHAGTWAERERLCEHSQVGGGQSTLTFTDGRKRKLSCTNLTYCCG